MRQEILLRMRLRDQMLVAYLVVVGAILSVSIGHNDNKEILLSIPFLALGSALIVSQHTVLAVYLGEFLSTELDECFKSSDVDEDIPRWDNSATFGRFRDKSNLYRLFAHTLMLLVPCIIALSKNIEHALVYPFPFETLLWWFGFFCLLCTAIIIFTVWLERLNSYIKRRWRNNKKLG